MPMPTGQRAVAHVKTATEPAQSGPPFELALVDHDACGAHVLVGELSRWPSFPVLLMKRSAAEPDPNTERPFVNKPVRASDIIEKARRQLMRPSLLFGSSSPSQPPPRRTSTDPSLPRSALADLHILIAEDNLMNRILAQRMLHSFGCTNVDAVENGAQALVREV